MFLPSSPLPKAVPAAGRIACRRHRFRFVFAISIESGTGSAEALAAATPIAQPTPLSRRFTQETASAATTGLTVYVSALRGAPALLWSTTRRRTSTATGNAPLLYIMDSGSAGPLGHLPDEVQPRRESYGRIRPPPRPLLLSILRSARCHHSPTATTQSPYGNFFHTAHAFSW